MLSRLVRSTFILKNKPIDNFKQTIQTEVHDIDKMGKMIEDLKTIAEINFKLRQQFDEDEIKAKKEMVIGIKIFSSIILGLIIMSKF